MEELSELIVGNYIKDGFEDIVFSSAMHVPGAAAETTARFEGKRRFPPLVMADGPAGLRLQPHFKATKSGDLLMTSRRRRISASRS